MTDRLRTVLMKLAVRDTNEITLMVLRMRAMQQGVTGLEETVQAMNSARTKAINNEDNRTATILGHAIWWLNSIEGLDPRKPTVMGWEE